MARSRPRLPRMDEDEWSQAAAGASSPVVDGSIWADPDDLDPDWRPPRSWSLAPRWVKVVTPVLALTIVVGLVWSLHGFDEARDTQTRVAFGSTITTGTVAITPRFAEWSNDRYDKVWKLAISGSCHHSPVVNAPETAGHELDDAILAARPNTRQVSTQTLVYFGEARQLGSSTQYSSLTPGAPPVPCFLSFEFDDPGTPVESEVVLLVADLRYRAEDLSQQGGSGWKLGTRTTVMRVPAVVRDPKTTDP
ncbi:hypothetical protein AESSP_01039 [Aestuariimicrobium sp. T2.26MG-19.2B]|nr:hypothetical protein AESSP_01039 [Aestuariimicrobium sp. T2.26MG-19.2B]